MKVVEGKGLWKRVIQLLRLRNDKPAMSCNHLLEAFAQVLAGAIFEDGRVRMKIVVRKHELKQLSSSSSFPLLSSMLSLEQQLQFLHGKNLRRTHSMKGRRGSWRPALQSIPEELRSSHT